MQPVDPIQRLILAFSRLPSIGEKTASRLTFFLLNQPDELSQELAQALAQLHQEVKICSICAHHSAIDPCQYCTDPKRNPLQICVVEDLSALMAVERTGEYHGLYHVLHGVISPLDGIGPDDLYIRHLLQRLNRLETSLSNVEVILATNPNVDGEATALYLHRLLKTLGVQVSRIASGIPMGSHLQYADQLSLAQALLSRRNL